MIDPSYVRGMAAYNAEMNRRLFAAAGALSDEQRKLDQGAYWGSLHGTLNHLLWADHTWLSRLAGWMPPSVSQSDSANLIENFIDLREARFKADADLLAWASELTGEWLLLDQVWFSGAAQRELRAPRQLLLVHLFNHQTHHRGQAHALLTREGRRTGDTDLLLVVSPDAFA